MIFWVLLVPIFVLIATFAGYFSVMFGFLIAIILWYCAVHSESLKSRSILLGAIFLTAFANACYVAAAF